MTLSDFLKRVDIEKDKDKIIKYCDSDGYWSNTEVHVYDDVIIISDSFYDVFPDGD